MPGSLRSVNPQWQCVDWEGKTLLTNFLMLFPNQHDTHDSPVYYRRASYGDTSDKFMQADLIGIGISKRLLYVCATLEDFSFQNCLHNNLVWLLNEPESVLPKSFSSSSRAERGRNREGFAQETRFGIYKIRGFLAEVVYLFTVCCLLLVYFPQPLVD